MIRPAYLDNPYAGHARRTTTDAARDACAIERHSSPWRLSELGFCLIVAGLGIAGLIVSGGF